MTFTSHDIHLPYGAERADCSRAYRAGPEIARVEGVHAMTDVTGFSLAGHALEMARGAGLTASIEWNAVPILGGADELATAGCVTGGSARNLASCKEAASRTSRQHPCVCLSNSDTALPQALELKGSMTEAQRALLTDPQTSGRTPSILAQCGPL